MKNFYNANSEEQKVIVNINYGSKEIMSTWINGSETVEMNASRILICQ